MHWLKSRITYANVVATLALFVALGGSSYAALTITGKSVKNNSLTTKDIRNRSLLKKDFKPGQLPVGPQGPKGDKGDKGDTGPAGTVPAPEAFHVVGAAGEPGFLNSWVAFGSGNSTPGFYKDAFGIVHLKGTLKGGTSSNTSTGNMFVLPAGYRPGESEQFSGGRALGSGQIAILSTGDVRALGGVDNTLQTIDGITFRAGQ